MSRKSSGSVLGKAAPAAFIALFIAGALDSRAAADEIYFKSGYSVTAVVIRETEASIRFKTKMGLSTISMEKIDFVDKASDEENQALRKKWREKELLLREQLEAKRKAKRKFETEQRAKGLVKHEGEWMTPEKRQEALTLQKRAVEHHMRFEDEQLQKGLIKFEHIWVTPKVEEKLIEMDEAIQELDDELRSQATRRDSMRRAMLGIPLEEAEEYSKQIEKLGSSMSANARKLKNLFKRADEIEAASVKYEVPEKFMEIITPDGELR